MRSTRKRTAFPYSSRSSASRPRSRRRRFDNGALQQALASLDLPLVPEIAEQQVDKALVQSLLALPRFRNVFSFVERGGWYSADAFVDWMAERLNSGTVNGSRA